MSGFNRRNNKSSKGASEHFLKSANEALQEYKDGSIDSALRVIEFVEQVEGCQEMNCRKLGISLDEYKKILEVYEQHFGHKLDLEQFRTY